MEQQRVIIIINPKTQDVTFEIDGVQGSTCKDITEVLMRGMTVKEQKDKIEFTEINRMPAYIDDL